MAKPSTGRMLRLIAGAVLAAAYASSVPATITDDITPFINGVQIGLHNPFTSVVSGTVTVTVVEADGQTATASTPYSVAPGGKSIVTVTFATTVASVLSVSTD